ncbi:MAG TPA: M56 family metallopeptidase [Thermoanaerobaculia bacterium]|nr:M56 family metallopeptidase [Thermoanaerobaculia bacterium]
MISDVVTHVVVSSAILAAALIAAKWIRPLTARTRHAILIAGMAAVALPAPLIARVLERNDIAPMPILAAPIAPPALLAAAAPDPARPVPWLAIVWLGVAAMLMLRWWIVTQRLVSTAMRAATPPPQRTKDALDAARRRLGLHHSIDLIASPTCEAPAVVRVLRPMIILPADGCSSLDDDELESLLCHECAHVARRDNLVGVAEAVVCSIFWFNPLVWLAHRRIASAREAACDERVADAALPAETYVGALAKICRALLAPRVPAVSCMASAHLKERIQHLMSYETLRKSAFSHRFTSAAAVAAVLLTIAAAGVVTANPVTAQDQYRVDYSMNRTAAGPIDIRTRIVDTKTNTVVGEPAVTANPGEQTVVQLGRPNGEWKIFVDTNSDGSGTLTLVVTIDGRQTQSTTTRFPAPGGTPARQYSGKPISLSLSNADIHDVLRAFGQLTGLEIGVAPDVTGTVNVDIKDMPWDQALEQILRENGLAYRLQGNKMEVFKP